jgi:hypothetical protein
MTPEQLIKLVARKHKVNPQVITGNYKKRNQAAQDEFRALVAKMNGDDAGLSSDLCAESQR